MFLVSVSLAKRITSLWMVGGGVYVLDLVGEGGVFLGFLHLVYEFEDSVYKLFLGDKGFEVRQGWWRSRRRVFMLVVELVVGLFVIVLHVVHEPGYPVLLFHFVSL